MVGAVNISGIFDNEFIEVGCRWYCWEWQYSNLDFYVELAMYLALLKGDAITILGVAYTIRIVQDDGTGMTTF